MKSLIKNSAWNVLGGSGSRLMNLFAMILVARTLQIEDFGAFSFIQSTLGAIAVFAGSSIGSVIIRQVSLHRSTDPDRVASLLGLMTVVVGVLSTSLAVLTAFLAPFLVSTMTFGEPVMLVTAFQIAAITLILVAARGLQDALLAGLGYYSANAKLKLTEGASLIFALPLLSYNFGLLGAVLGVLFSQFLPIVAGLMAAASALRKESIVIDFRNIRSESSSVTTLGLPTFLSGVLSLPALWFGLYYLGRTDAGLSEIAIFNAAYLLYGPLLFVPLMMNSAAIPPLAKMWQEADTENLKATISKLLMIAAAISAMPALMMALFSESVMSIYGVEYSDRHAVLLPLLISAPLAAKGKLFSTILETFGFAWVAFRNNLISAFILILICIPLVPEYGALGLSISILVGSIFQVSLHGIEAYRKGLSAT